MQNLRRLYAPIYVSGHGPVFVKSYGFSYWFLTSLSSGIWPGHVMYFPCNACSMLLEFAFIGMQGSGMNGNPCNSFGTHCGTLAQNTCGCGTIAMCRQMETDFFWKEITTVISSGWVGGCEGFKNNAVRFCPKLLTFITRHSGRRFQVSPHLFESSRRDLAF